jgi:hypothetical protein
MYAKAGPLSKGWDDARRFPRFYCRGRIQATIYPLEGSPAQPPERCTLLTRDLSRGGMNVLHVEELTPGQKIDVILSNGSPRTIEVMWCRRMAVRCYSVGCRFVKPTEKPGEPPSSAAP